MSLVAVSVESAGDALDHAGLQRVGAAEFADPLLILAGGKVARASGAVLHLAASGEAKSLLRAFVCLLLGHIRVPEPNRFGFWVESTSVAVLRQAGKGGRRVLRSYRPW